MRIFIYLILFCLVVSCNQFEKEEAETIDTSTSTKPIQAVRFDSLDFTVSERKLRCGNNIYYNKTTPFIDTISKKYAAKILLYNKKDTILLKTVNLDTLLNIIIIEHLWNDSIISGNDSIKLEEFKTYNIVDIIPTPLIRGCNTYLIAKLLKDNSQDIFLTFAIKTFGDQISYRGRLWIYQCTYDDQFYKYYKNQIINAHNTKIKAGS